MNKTLYNDLINACNKCILSCEASLKNCKYYSDDTDTNNLSNTDKENCGVSHQDLITDFQHCIHECNLVLEDKVPKIKEKEDIIKKCKDMCKDTMDRCQESIRKILNGDKEGVIWALDQINNCIMTCDECIETLSKNN